MSGNLVYQVLRKQLVSGAVLLGTLAYLGNRAFDLDIRGLYIALGTLIVAISAFVAQKWGKWALKRSLLFADTPGANLLEHKKAGQFKSLYLPKLYANVYGTRTLAVEDVLWVDEKSRQLRLHHQLAKFEYQDTLRQVAEMLDTNLISETVSSKVDY